MNDIATKLRHHAVTLRTNSMPLADLIPLLQQAADALDQSAALARQAALQSMIEEAEKLGLYDEAAPQAEQQDERDLAINAETCAVCGEGKALLVRSCSCCGSLYAGSAEMRENRKQAGQAPAPGADSTEGLRQLLAVANENDSARWEIGFRNIVAILYGPRHKFEIADVVERIREIASPAVAQQTCQRCVVYCQGGTGCHAGCSPITASERDQLEQDQRRRAAPIPSQGTKE